MQYKFLEAEYAEHVEKMVNTFAARGWRIEGVYTTRRTIVADSASKPILTYDKTFTLVIMSKEKSE